MDSSRPVVVDSLLCFLANFRHEPSLQATLLRHFSPHSIAHSLRLLLQLATPPNGAMAEEDPFALAPDDLLRALLAHFDRLCASPQSPIFSAADLLSLPLRPLYDDADGGGGSVRSEMRQIRFLLQDLVHRDSRSAPTCVQQPQHSVSFSPACVQSSLARLPSLVPTSSGNISSSPECPPVRPALAQTPPNKQREVTTSNNQNNKNGNNSGAASSPSTPLVASPTKGCGRLDSVVEKLKLREREESNGSEEADRGHKDHRMMDTEQPGPLECFVGANIGAPLFAGRLAYMEVFRQLVAERYALTAAAGEQRADDKGEQQHEEAMLEEQWEKSPKVKGEFNDQRRRNDDVFGESEEQRGLDAESPALSEGGSSEAISMLGGGRAAEEGEEEADGGDKRLSCAWPNCQKRFANKFLLKKHQFIHSGQKPHQCPFCAKQFNRKDNLLRHKKTHLQNGMAEQEGVKRRHNMLYGITEAQAILSGMLPLSARQQRGKREKRDSNSARARTDSD